MRALEFHTLIDPFEARFGAKWAVVLALPAVLAEMFWSAELLVALGSTFGVVLDLNLTTGIVISAAVVTLYTMAGGMWAVAYTDAFQLLLVGVGLAAALPFALSAAGGLEPGVGGVSGRRRTQAALSSVSWWDVSVMLMLGGVPWNCYFQRVLSCRTPRAAQAHSILSGLLTIALTIPPLLMGLVAFAYAWPPALADRLAAQPADALPLIFRVRDAAGHRTARPGRDCRRGDVELLVVDPVGGIDVRVECVCGACCRPDMSVGALTMVMRVAIALARRRRGVDGAEGSERAGAVVLHERPGVRAAVSAAGVGALRQQGQPDRIDRGVRRIARPAIGRGRAALWNPDAAAISRMAAVQDDGGRRRNDPVAAGFASDTNPERAEAAESGD